MYLNETGEDFSSSDDDYYEEDIPKSRTYNQNQQGQQNGGHRVYHENAYTKIDQKLCLSKVQACENQ